MGSDRELIVNGAWIGALLGVVIVIVLIVRARRRATTLPAPSIDPATPVPDGRARVEVVTTHSPLAFLYATMRPNVRLDGELHSVAWGTSCFDVAPGRHTVAISYPWLVQECGKAGTELEVGPGEIRRVTYHARNVRFVRGRLTVEDVVPAARVVKS